jgi:CRISPR-associated endoribonuclease Cas6
MRFKITLAIQKQPCIIPINYQYELSAWIYARIQQADKEYASFLHEQGYQSQHKTFKFFTFSNLNLYPFQRQDDRMRLTGKEIYFIISFFIDQAAEKFIMGLFQDQFLRLGDKTSQGEFMVKQVEVLPYEITSNAMRFTTLAPMVIAQKRMDGGIDYLAPEHPDFGELLIQNLISKYMAIVQNAPTLAEEAMQDITPQFKLLDTKTPKSRLVTIKADKASETRVKGFYNFDFELTAPRILLEIGLLAGFGKHNAEGFGSCETPSPALPQRGYD